MTIHQFFPIGSIFMSNYSERKFQLKTIIENCTMPSCKEMWHKEPTAPHLHFSSTDLTDKSHANHSSYVLKDGELVSLFSNDKLIILYRPTQLALF